MTLPQENVHQITLTEAAATAFQELLAQRELSGFGLRIFISSGGGCSCNGYEYGMAFENNPAKDDIISEQFGVKLIMDQVSAEYMAGATIDYVESEMGTGFKIDNPNVVGSSCGCSSSEGESCSC